MPPRKPTLGVPAPLNSTERRFESAKTFASAQHNEEVVARDKKTAHLKAQRDAQEKTTPKSKSTGR
jgi:hypothetical protein